jgi:multiple sugar transport system permease protein
MSDTVVTPGVETEVDTHPRSRFQLFSGRRGRKAKETILAYALLIPAFIIVFVFGLFPLAFSAYQSSLRGLNKILGTYDGLGNYVKAIDNLAYVLGFWLSLILVYLAISRVLGVRRESQANSDSPWLLVIPAVVMGFAVGLFARFVFVLLPKLLAIPNKMRGQENTSALFRQFLGEALTSPAVQSAFWSATVLLAIAIALSYLVFRYTNQSRRGGSYYSALLTATVLILGAAVLVYLTWQQVQLAYAEAAENGQGLDLWTQIITISAGLVLLLLSYLLFRSASYRSSNLSMVLRIAGAAMLIVGAWVLIGELPRLISAGDEDWWQGLKATIFYSLGTVPVQLLLALLLATLLFQAIKGKTVFRMIFFLPYIAPAVGTAAAFRILFSGRVNAPVNSLLTAIGMDPLLWLNEPTGIFQLIAGSSTVLPEALAGPSLALVVIMIFGTWSYVGWNTVIFLAGLGAIPGELYEAAAIDGANRWAQFRHVTLPLLSPVIYFLVLWSTIGTFKAFNHIYVLREGAALGTTDTASVVIFQAFNRDTRYGYASALAILLLLIIMILTAVNNRIASKRVFYG